MLREELTHRLWCRLPPKCILKADKEAGRIIVDSETTLTGIPPEAWDYRLGNCSALEWILDQYKEKKPKDPTIREKFNTYGFADYKEKVIDLLMRVTTVSVSTVMITDTMRKILPRNTLPSNTSLYEGASKQPYPLIRIAFSPLLMIGPRHRS